MYSQTPILEICVSTIQLDFANIRDRPAAVISISKLCHSTRAPKSDSIRQANPKVNEY